MALGFVATAQPPYIKFKQLERTSPVGQVKTVITGTDGALSYTATLPVGNIPNLPAYQPTVTGGYVPYQSANSFTTANSITAGTIVSDGPITATNGIATFSNVIANGTFSSAGNSTVGILKVNSNGVFNYGPGTFTTNSVYGFNSLVNNTTGDGSCAFGNSVLQNNTTGYNNVGVGYFALNLNTIGRDNVAVGLQALQTNSTGNQNTAIGSSALTSNTTGTGNTALGGASMFSNTTGDFNIGVGLASLYANTIGSKNSSFGYNSFLSLTTGSSNIGIGYGAGLGITTGSANTIIGSNLSSLTNTTSNNIILADGAGNIKYQWNGTTNIFTGPITGTASNVTFSDVIANGTSTNVGNSLFQASVGIGGQVTSTLSSFRLVKGTGTIDIGQISAGFAGIWMNETPSTTNWVIGQDGSSTYLNAKSANSIYLSVAASPVIRVLSTVTQHYNPMNIGAAANPVASAVLETTSTTRGFLPPRMTTTQKNAISSPATGLVVYDTTLNKLCVYTGAAWETITSL